MLVPKETITLPRSLTNVLLTHAQQGEDNEVCGLISRNQDPRQPSDYRHHPIANIADDRPHRYISGPCQPDRCTA